MTSDDFLISEIASVTSDPSMTSNETWPAAFILSNREFGLCDVFKILFLFITPVSMLIFVSSFALNLKEWKLPLCWHTAKHFFFFYCTKLLSATLRITFKPLACLRLAFLQPALRILSQDCSALLSPLCSCVVFVAISRNSWIASQWP